jgi:hypothetical protein
MSPGQPLASTAGRAASSLTAKHLPLCVGLLGGALLLPCIDDGFQLDDHLQRSALVSGGERSGLRVFEFYSGEPTAAQRLLDSGLMPWWAAPGFRHYLLRYVSAATMQLDYMVWPDHPAMMHLHSLLWLCALLTSAAYLYREVMGPRWTAGLAALLYAIDDAHALPASYLANRNALISATFGVLCILCHARWRRCGSVLGAVLSPVCLALALGAGELAVATPGYLCAYGLFLDRASLGRRITALAPNGCVALGWLFAYQAGGFGARGSGYYDDPLGDPLAFLTHCAQNIPRLLFGQWTPIPAELTATPTLRVASILATLLLLALLFPLVRRDRVARFFALGALFSLLPIAATGPMNRLLFFVGLGSMGLLSLGLASLFTIIHDRARPRLFRTLAGGLTALLLVAHVLLAPPAALAMVDYQARVSATHNRALASVPHDPQISAQDLVLLNPPDYPYSAMCIAPVKSLQGLPVARRLRALVATSTAMHLTRLDATTLQATLSDGLFTDPFSRYFRGKQVAFKPGDHVQVPGLWVEIQSLNAAGDPDRLRYRFEHPLEHPSLRWLRWNDGRYEPWQPPSIGQSTYLPAPSSLFQL